MHFLNLKIVFLLQTNEVNQGDALEHNFNAVYSALLLPISHIFPVQEFPQVTVNASGWLERMWIYENCKLLSDNLRVEFVSGVRVHWTPLLQGWISLSCTGFDRIKCKASFSLYAQTSIFITFFFLSVVKANYEILVAHLVGPVQGVCSLCCSGCNSRRKPVLWRALCQNPVWARRWNFSSEYKPVMLNYINALADRF